MAYLAEWDQFTSAGPTPQTVPGRNQAAFEPSSAFRTLGWMPEGMVRCQYQVVAVPGATPEAADFVATSKCDVDGDGEVSIYTANRESPATLITPINVY